METTVKGKTSEVIINTEGPVKIIGESINPTRRKKLIETLQAKDFSFVFELAESQIAAGADILDVNVGYPGVDDENLMPEVVQAMIEKFDVPLCLDSPNPKALEAGLKVAPEGTMINSVTGEEKSLEALIPVIKKHNAVAIGLTMDDDGIANDSDKRLAIAGKILERAAKEGIPETNIIIDPLTTAVSADPSLGNIILDTAKKVREKFGVNLTAGASNISFGLPDRHAINQAFLVLAIMNGVTCPITNPVKLAKIIKATDLLLARDDYGMNYITYHQEHEG